MISRNSSTNGSATPANCIGMRNEYEREHFFGVCEEPRGKTAMDGRFGEAERLSPNAAG